MTHPSTVTLISMTVWLPSILSAQNCKPNFVFMMAEDVAPQFVGLYNEGQGAQLPQLEALATEGIVFNNAYSNAPVSSAARSTLFTGCYAPRVGVSFHRKLEEVPLPLGQHLFPAYLRQSGYFTVNAFKTDYNCITDSIAWDIIDGKMGGWRQRRDKHQPFLFVRTNGKCHESCLHFTRQQMAERKTIHSPQSVRLLPMHPDTELFRYTYATFYDRLLTVDNELGEMIRQLHQDGELDNTFIFYMGDNGGSLPGTKGYTTEGGLQVPLVVYIPKNWRNRIPIPLGSRINGLVSFVDLGPTLLHLAGIKVPHSMDGTPFMGEDISVNEMNRRDIVYGYGDRFDELYAFSRTVRRGHMKYARNFIPYHPKSLYAFYRYKQLAFVQWKELYEAGKLNDTQKRFFEPQDTEELYDLDLDPNETHNLALLPSYQKELQQMRSLLFSHMTEMNDLGILPECIWMTEGRQSPAAYGTRSHRRIQAALRTANLQLLSFEKGKEKALKALRSTDPVQRYWALTACICWGKEANALLPLIEAISTTDTEPFIRSRAWVFRAQIDGQHPVDAMKRLLADSRNTAESLSILNDMAYLKEQHPHWIWGMKESQVPYPHESTSWRVRYLNH